MIVVLGLGIVMLVCVVVLVALLLCNNSVDEDDCRLVKCKSHRIASAPMHSLYKCVPFHSTFFSVLTRHISFAIILFPSMIRMAVAFSYVIDVFSSSYLCSLESRLKSLDQYFFCHSAFPAMILAGSICLFLCHILLS